MTTRPRGVGDVLTSGINMLARTWRSLVAPSVGAYILLGALTLVTFQMTGANEFLQLSFNDPQALEDMAPEEFLEVSTPFLQALLIGLVFQILASAFISLAATRVVASEVGGERISGGAASRFALSRMLTMTVIALITAIGISVGLVLLVLPGVWLAVSVSLAPQVVALDNRGVIGSITRSIRLVNGRWWGTFGFLLLVGLVGSVAGWLLQSVAVPLVAIGDVSTGLALVFVGGLIFQGLVTSAIAVVITMWFFELVAREKAKVRPIPS